MAAGDRSVSAAVEKRLGHLAVAGLSSPKRAASTETWYSYYAGYADAFVREIVEALAPLHSDSSLLLDPWNGAGTTTSIATDQRWLSAGLDLNPAAVVIARARLLRSDVGGSIKALTAEVLASARRSSEPCPREDPLHMWFGASTVAHLRAIERSIYRLLVTTDNERRLVEPGMLDGDRVSSLAALFYLGLFRAVRPLMARFIGSNPTWIKRNVDPSERFDVETREIDQRYRTAMKELLKAVSAAKQTVDYAERTRAYVGSCAQTGLDDDSVHAIITSPPYCTRIDYVIATLPELAVLGIRTDEIARLRADMIGTPVVRGQPDDMPAAPKVRRFLDDVEQHDSYAAKSYYWKFFRSYFDGMERSFAELDRVARTGSPIVFVVQDSWFKQMHVPVPEILAEYGERLGWTKVSSRDYPVPTNRAGMHRHARRYRSSTRAIESVLIFRAG